MGAEISESIFIDHVVTHRRVLRASRYLEIGQPYLARLALSSHMPWARPCWAQPGWVQLGLKLSWDLSSAGPRAWPGLKLSHTLSSARLSLAKTWARPGWAQPVHKLGHAKLDHDLKSIASWVQSQFEVDRVLRSTTPWGQLWLEVGRDVKSTASWGRLYLEVDCVLRSITLEFG